MESLFIPLVSMVIENPQWVVIIDVMILVLMFLVWKFTLSRLSKKLASVESKFDVHAIDSANRGLQTEDIKSSVAKIEGMLSIISMSSAGRLK